LDVAVAPMYDAKADFVVHGDEVSEGLRILRAHGWLSGSEQVALDLGGGQGMHSGFLSESFSGVYCVDILNYTTLYDGDFCKRIVDKHEEYGIPIHPGRIKFIESDAMNLMFKENFFDCCLCFNAFEHIPDPGKALREIVRTLKPGGYAYITFDPIWTADSGSHFLHRVGEPWAHLLLSESSFIEQMRNNGATVSETIEFGGAMNRWRYGEFLAIFRAFSEMVLFHDTYLGFESEHHQRHVNYEQALKLGYSVEELALRRLRWLIQKPRLS